LKWKTPPTVVDMARHYPVGAKAKQIARGSAEVACAARNDSGAPNCQVVAEEPQRAGFGAAALVVMSRAKVEAVDGGPSKASASAERCRSSARTGARPGREDIFQDRETPGQIGRCFPSQVQVR
jgi:hypothetical protein